MIFGILLFSTLFCSCIKQKEPVVIDLSGQPAGIYFINITDKNGRQSVKKIVRE